MYSTVFTFILIIILGWKSLKLFKNKKEITSLEDLDTFLTVELNEGDSDEK